MDYSKLVADSEASDFPFSANMLLIHRASR